jgi:polysaccharide pyruvyl transferase WcaK-like protein
MMGASIWRSTYEWLRRGKRIAATKRLGMGLGFGSYTLSSDRYAADLAEISSFNLLIVRDPASLAKIRLMTPGIRVSLATDLVFLTSLWLSQSSVNSNGRVIGFILRDWPGDRNAHHVPMKALANLLTKSGYEVRCYSLDARADVDFIADFKDFKMQIWRPGKQNLDSFVSDLASCSMIVSSRAHGAIVSACLGVPSICLEIEPKLASVTNMLSESSILVKPPYSAELMRDLISERMNRLDELRAAASVDVERNRQLMGKSLEEAEALLIGA